jgi:KDO2-lipid IV(A) lauroyltransferase
MKSRIIYILVYSGMWLMSLLPFRFLYIISDVGYLFVYHIVRYRRKVTATNLKNSFPDKSKKWLKTTEKHFYHYICDYFLEDIKLMHLSLDELEKRMLYLNKEIFLEMVEKHDGIILIDTSLC